nr:hypothetical protein [uncultured bacterium]
MKQPSSIIGSLSRRPASTLAGLALVIASAFILMWTVWPSDNVQPLDVNREAVAEPSEPSSNPQLIAGVVLLGGWAAAGGVMFWKASRRLPEAERPKGTESDAESSDQQSKSNLELR